jgi:flagellar biosynthesis protein FlhF
MVMQNVQTFSAPTMHEALTKVREQLGADAVILHTRQVPAKGMFGKKTSMVEISAARGVINEIDTSAPQPPPAPALKPAAELKTESLTPPVSPLEDQVRRLQSLVDRLSSPLPSGLVAQEVHSSTDTPPNRLNEVEKYLRDIEMPDSLVRECTDVIEHECPVCDDPFSDVVMNRLTDFLMSRIQTQPLIETSTPQSTIAFVGPTGVGKTTTIAKLAVYAMEELQRPVSLASIDGYRIGAAEEIRRYAEIVGCPWLLARNPSELRRFIDRQPLNHLVFVDTPGRSPVDVDAIRDLMPYLERGMRTVLVLAANNRESAVRASLDAFRPLDYERLILTKLDETPGTGAIAGIAACSSIPLSYVCLGQDVRQDLEAADSAWLARWSLGEAARRPAEPVIVHA